MDEDDASQDGKSTGGTYVRAGFGSADSHPGTGAHRLPPQRVLVVGRFGGAGGPRRHRVDPTELADLPARLGVSLDVEVDNMLGDRPSRLAGRVEFASLRDFAPQRIAERFPPLVEAASIVAGGGSDSRFSRLSDAATAGTGVSVAAPKSHPEPARRSADDDSSVDRLLGMVDPGTAEAGGESTAQRAVSAFISGMGTRAAPKEPADGVAALLMAQRGALFSDPELCALLETWQGLRLLARSLEPTSGACIELVDTGDDDPAETLAGILAEDDALAHPPALTVIAERLSASTRDMERARRIARAAEAAQTPAVAALASAPASGFDIAQAAGRDDPGSLFAGPGFEVFDSLREEPASRWLALCWNDVLVRTADNDGPALWMAPSWVVASQVLRSIASTGWPSEIVGRKDAVDGFEVHETTVAGRRVACATAAPVPAAACHSLADAGILVLTGSPDRDDVFSLAAPTVHRPGRFPDDPHGRAARLLSSLPYQLAAARFAALLAQARRMFAELPSEDLAMRTEEWLSAAIADTGAGATASVSIEPHPDDAARSLLSVDARTGGSVMGGESFSLDVPV